MDDGGEERSAVRSIVRNVAALAVIGGLGWLGWVMVFGTEGSRRLRVLDAEVRLLHHRVELFKFWDERGVFPEYLDDTMSLRRANPVSEWNRYARERGKQCVDPWNESLGYARDADGSGFEVRSSGPDGRMGTQDDLVLRGGGADDRKAAYEEYRAKSEEYERLRPKRSKKRNTW